MSIVRVSIPTPTSPGSLTDYQAILTQLIELSQGLVERNAVFGSLLKAGTVMVIGGVIYKVTVDETITGTPSNYVKVTPAGASASAAFVASLSGVTWNDAYGGYYDVSGNLYLFREITAVNAGAIATPRTRLGIDLLSYVGSVANGTRVTTVPYGATTGTIALPSCAIGDTVLATFKNTSSRTVNLPAGGTYHCWWQATAAGSLASGAVTGGEQEVSGGTTVPVSTLTGFIFYTRLT